jgi:hypothetical protein
MSTAAVCRPKHWTEFAGMPISACVHVTVMSVSSYAYVWFTPKRMQCVLFASGAVQIAMAVSAEPGDQHQTQQHQANSSSCMPGVPIHRYDTGLSLLC